MMADYATVADGRHAQKLERGRQFMAKVKSDTDRVAAERDLEVRNV